MGVEPVVTATESSGASGLRLGADEKSRLLHLAREALEAAAHGLPLPATAGEGGVLSRPGAAFVTLHSHGQLRGCIGCVEPGEWSLAETVVRMAVAASRSDPRFRRVAPGEIDGLDIEISVLGPLVPVVELGEVEIGRDGLVAEQAGRRGLLLPQVATEWRWDRATFAGHACLKAGLAADSWQRGAKLFRFEAEVFGEEDEGRAR